MAGYNTIRGLRVKYLSADPSGAEQGEVWYNSTTGNLRLANTTLSGTWSAANACNTGRRFFQGCGSQTNGIMAGGFAPGAPSPVFNQTEEFDGTNFTNTSIVPGWHAKPVPLGILLGLFIGKQLGVMMFSFIAIKFKIAQMV